MSNVKHGVTFKTPSGRFLSAAGRCAVRLEVGIWGRPSKEVAEMYGVTRQRVERLSAGIPSFLKDGAAMMDVITAARACWKREDGRQGSEAAWTLVLLDALALLIGDERLSSSTLLNNAVRGAAVSISTVLEAQHVG